ncbi:hypothetical protein REPUB_Repub07fG0153700 [Reevesia pubescens]
MAFAISNPAFVSSSISPLLKTARVRTNSWRLNSNLSSEVVSRLQSEGGGRRVWRRRKLAKKDEMLQYKLERIPFLEEQVRKIREGGKLLTMDIDRLLLSEDNRFDFVNDVAAEPKNTLRVTGMNTGVQKKLYFMCSVTVLMILGSTGQMVMLKLILSSLDLLI